MKRVLAAALVLFSLTMIAGCTRNNPASATSVEILFTVDNPVVAIGGSTTMRWQTNYTGGCWIEPDIGNVSCTGAKVWTFPLAGLYKFTLHVPDGRSSQQVQVLVK